MRFGAGSSHVRLTQPTGGTILFSEPQWFLEPLRGKRAWKKGLVVFLRCSYPRLYPTILEKQQLLCRIAPEIQAVVHVYLPNSAHTPHYLWKLE